MQAEAAAMQSGNGGDSGRKLRLLTLADLDGRTRARQRAEELRERVISERGGPDQIDVMRAAHTDTWALLTAMIEDLMARYILGEPIEPSSVATLINARRREGEAIGEPTPRDVSPPDVDRYLAHRRAQEGPCSGFCR